MAPDKQAEFIAKWFPKHPSVEGVPEDGTCWYSPHRRYEWLNQYIPSCSCASLKNPKD